MGPVRNTSRQAPFELFLPNLAPFLSVCPCLSSQNAVIPSLLVRFLTFNHVPFPGVTFLSFLGGHRHSDTPSSFLLQTAVLLLPYVSTPSPLGRWPRSERRFVILSTSSWAWIRCYFHTPTRDSKGHSDLGSVLQAITGLNPRLRLRLACCVQSFLGSQEDRLGILRAEKTDAELSL